MPHRTPFFATMRWHSFLPPALLLVLGLATSCGDHPTGPHSQPDEFPNAVGWQWSYTVRDSLHHSTQALRVQIVSRTILPDGKPASLWLYSRQSGVDTFFVRVAADTVSFYGPLDLRRGMLPLDRYVLPLQVGRGWIAPFFGQDSVVAVRQLVVPAGAFPNTFEIRGDGGCCNYYWTHTKWFVPGVGLIQLRRFQIDTIGGFWVHETWRLTSYQPPA